MGNVVLSAAGVPFGVARALLQRFEPDASDTEFRFIRHIESSDKAEATTLKSQLRYRNKTRCLLEVRWLAARMSVRGTPATIHISGSIHESDVEFLEALRDRHVLQVELNDAGAADVAEEATGENNRVRDDARWIDDEFTRSHDWVQLRRRVARYMRCGDSWTARWLLERALAIRATPTPEVLDLCGLIYQLQEMPERAGFFFELALDAGGRVGVSAANSLAMLHAQHLPPALRDLQRAEMFLDRSLDLLDQVPTTEDSALDRALNYNSRSYLKILANRPDEAVVFSRTVLQRLPEDARGSQAHAVLANNLGRLLARQYPHSEEIEPLLVEAIQYEPRHPEFHLDLALHLAARSRNTEAMSAVDAAEDLTTSIAEIPALKGYLLHEAGDYRASVAEYRRALRIDPSNADHVLSACRSASAAGNYREVLTIAASADGIEADANAQAQMELLVLEARSFVETLPQDHVR